MDDASKHTRIRFAPQLDMKPLVLVAACSSMALLRAAKTAAKLSHNRSCAQKTFLSKIHMGSLDAALTS